MPSLPEVRSWNTALLSDAAARTAAADSRFLDELASASRGIDDLGHDWSGIAYDAARDRVDAERAAGQSLSNEVRDLAKILDDGAQRLYWARDAALARVEAALAEGCTVLDDWSVVGGAGAFAELLVAHRDAVAEAAAALAREDTEVARLIEDAAQRIRARGDRIGSGGAPSDSTVDGAGRLGNEDGAALATAAAAGDVETLDRIAGQLPVQGLTAAELDTLAAGGQVGTLPQTVRDYYAELYRAAGKDGVLALGDHLRTQEAGGDPRSGRALNSLANGLMVVSNENIGNGYNPDGSLRSPGSYDQLPSDLREVISTRTHGDDANAIRYPGESGALGDQYRFHEDTRRLGELLKESEPGYAPGTEFARELTRQAANLAEGTALSGADPTLVEQSMRDYLEVSGRNHEAITQLLTGEGSDRVPLDSDYRPANTLTPLLQFDWSDDRGAPNLFGWIGENAIPGAEISVAQSEQAGRAATGLISLITDGTSGQFESMMNLPGHDGRSLGEVNPGLTQQFAQAVTPYLGDIARGPELQTHGFDREAAVGEGGDIRSIRLATLMNTDPTAAALFNGAIIERTNDYAGRFGELHGESSVIRYQLGEASGRLLGYMDQGLRAEAYDRGLDDAAAAEQSADRTKLAIDVATKTVVGLGGPATIPLDIASSMVQAGITPEESGLPAESFDVSDNLLAGQRAYHVLEAVAAKDPSVLDGLLSDGDPLIPSGWVDDGRLRSYSEIVATDGRLTTAVELRTIAEEALDRGGLRLERFNAPLDEWRGNLQEYTSDAAHYENRILADPQVHR
ncbi:hypothetical protein [Prescottella equi]|uniref:TPR repeat region-containing protein n=1 Tax=Rhodococcus hoagii TaxID=43767 RepID=UPI001C754E06|nr:hypothetical protein [Prescottella equi]BCN78128.1 hypothetical protein RE0346_17880 [Prescottella equi]